MGKNKSKQARANTSNKTDATLDAREPEDFQEDFSEDFAEDFAEDLPAPVRQITLAEGIVGLIFCLTALFASAELVLTEIEHYKNPSGPLGCDLNPLVGCGSSLTTWQAHLFFGVPNALLGTIFFTALATIFVLLIFRMFLPKWMWWALAAGGLGGIALVIFFLYQSVATFGTLCPWCLVVWTSTLPIATMLITNALRLNMDTDSGLARFCYRGRWLLLAILFVLVIFVIVIGMGSRLILIF